jgi:hypothetical protein
LRRQVDIAVFAARPKLQRHHRLRMVRSLCRARDHVVIIRTSKLGALRSVW